MGRPKDTFDLHPTSLGYWNFAVAYTSCIHQLLNKFGWIIQTKAIAISPTPFKKKMDKKNQIKISPNDQPDYPVNSVINLLTCTTLTKCCTAINAAVNNNDNGKIV